ncbi:MAG: MoxR family ATPase [Gammaproteobacteria bacterium]|nr:MoxR family ATPase [Gammaproteobacteria bacterium]
MANAFIEPIVKSLSQVILGKEPQIRLALACLLARGHLLLEDLPGMGKTTLAQGLARCLGLGFQRLQFTSDLLPSDILGVAVYRRDTESFQFHPGPIFHQLILVDEVNRATPKTQSALLEAMEEHQVSLDGVTHRLPEPFFVIATQNPAYQIGTFPLPESQLDRFMMRIELGYPDPRMERELLKGRNRREVAAELPACLDKASLQALQDRVPELTVSELLLDYILALVAHTRSAPQVAHGLSPRAGLALLRAAQGYALVHGRDYVLPEDVQAVFPAVAGHRLRPQGAEGHGDQALAQRLMQAVPVPV